LRGAGTGAAAGAKIALSYALLGAFAMAVAHSGLPQLLAQWQPRSDGRLPAAPGPPAPRPGGERAFSSEENQGQKERG